MKRLFGRGVAPDARDAKFAMAGVPVSDRQYRYWSCGKVLDQGAESSCVGHAWAGWLAAAPVSVDPIAASGIYDFAKFLDEWQGENYDGTSVRAGAKVVKMAGHIESYSWCWDVKTAVNWVLERGPLVVGTDWTEGMMTPNKSGFISTDGDSVGGHAYLIYGVNVSKGFFSLRNSWGAEWGIRGNARVSIADFEQLLLRDGECCSAVEKKR